MFGIMIVEEEEQYRDEGVCLSEMISEGLLQFFARVLSKG
jgi:hypothetical protein